MVLGRSGLSPAGDQARGMLEHLRGISGLGPTEFVRGTPNPRVAKLFTWYFRFLTTAQFAQRHKADSGHNNTH